MSVGPLGSLVARATGSGSTWYCDYVWVVNDGSIKYLFCGGSVYLGSASGGAFAFNVIGAPLHADWSVGCGLSFV